MLPPCGKQRGGAEATVPPLLVCWFLSSLELDVDPPLSFALNRDKNSCWGNPNFPNHLPEGYRAFPSYTVLQTIVEFGDAQSSPNTAHGLPDWDGYPKTLGNGLNFRGGLTHYFSLAPDDLNV
jgi:hypothetical protein